jgi:hypothetical protein
MIICCLVAAVRMWIGRGSRFAIVIVEDIDVIRPASKSLWSGTLTFAQGDRTLISFLFFLEQVEESLFYPVGVVRMLHFISANP